MTEKSGGGKMVCYNKDTKHLLGGDYYFYETAFNRYL